MTKPDWMPGELWERMEQLAEAHSRENARDATPLELRRGRNILLGALTDRLRELPRLPDHELVEPVDAAIRNATGSMLATGSIECRRSVHCFLDALRHGVASTDEFDEALAAMLRGIDRVDVMRAVTLLYQRRARLEEP